MTISIWRYSHLILAISSSIFILIASVTGAILAIEPISNQLKPYAVKNADALSLAATISTLERKYDEIISIKRDNNSFVSASVINKNGKSDTFYINPFTGEKIGDIIVKAKIYKFSTNLHRSLFLKSTGRIIIGFVSLLLLLIAISGILLILKRQGGFKRFFSKIVKDNFQQYYHIIVGRLTLLPIAIIALTGVYLSLEKFSLLPVTNISHHIDFNEIKTTPKLNIIDFNGLKGIKLKDVKQVDFPFSKDPEDYFQIKLLNKELLINQYTGSILSEQKVSIVALASYWSFMLHTGTYNIWWSFMLLPASLSTLFFMYSGFSITLKRKNANPFPKNKYSPHNSDYIILVGSETGSTLNFAASFYKALLNSSKKAFISELNAYNLYKKAKHIIIFTSTYGEGEAPSNAKIFEKRLHKIIQANTIKYSIVGFGSLAYSGFCKYALDVDNMLQKHPNFTANIALKKINNQSFEAFKTWAQHWSKSNALTLQIQEPKNKIDLKTIKPFTVVNKTDLNIDNTFLIRLQPTKKTKFTSGDLLSIYPENSTVERLYSMGKINNDIVLSIKKHEFGVCSSYFSQLNKKDMINATIKQNKDFHFPKKGKEVIMIANGTGIAPYLGMINENKNNIKTHLFWGGRTKASFNIYADMIYHAFANKLLTSINIAYSQESKQKTYVQELINDKADFMADLLKKGGVIMICGSIAMQNSVMELLEHITTSKLNTPLSVFKKKNQIKTDCY